MTTPAESLCATMRGDADFPEPTEADLLTTVLEPCRIRGTVGRPWRLTAPWGFCDSESPPGFVIVLEGECLLDIGDDHSAVTLHAQDLVIGTRTQPLRLRDCATSAVIPVDNPLGSDFPPVSQGAAYAAGSARTRLLCGTLTLDDDYTRQIFDLFPPVLVLRGSAVGTEGAVASLATLLIAESEQTLPGGELLCGRLLQILLVHAFRQSTVQLPETAGGLLLAMRAPGLGATMSAIHSRPEHDWSVHELADLAGLSRAAFAARFLDVIGMPPFQYLRDVRMRLACRMLRESEKGIKEIAARVGYSSEASFSKAFTRWCGRAPGEFRRQARRPQ